MEEISSARNPIIRRFRRLRESRRTRYEEEAVVVEGVKMVRELAQQGIVRCVVTNDPQIVPEGDFDVYLAPGQLIEKIAGSRNPEGIVAEVAMPRFAFPDSLKRVVVLDNVADPGNMGTILRSALALGWDGVYLVGDCCDPYNDKALRAAKGATFRLPLLASNHEHFLTWADRQQAILLAADAVGDDCARIEITTPFCLLLGSESHGVNDLLAERARMVSVPMSGQMESLNVGAAAAILLYLLGGVR